MGRAFALDRLLDEAAAAGRPYLEFLREPSMSVGLYVLAAGAQILQSPHTEDEVYVVLDGRSRFTTGDLEVEVGPGSILFVPAGEAHRFHDITEPLHVAVVFAPPEGSLAG